MGRQQAREYLVKDQIEILKTNVLQTVQDLSNCAILLQEALAEPGLSLLHQKYPGVPVQLHTGVYPNYARFLLWNPKAVLDRNLIAVGFSLLDHWQIAVPLYNYKVLAEHVGTPEDRERVKEIIHDLRVPIYDTRVMFVRQCAETRDLFERWDYGTELDFLVALYQTRPVINALPPTWILKA
jgi:hypothetical protein